MTAAHFLRRRAKKQNRPSNALSIDSTHCFSSAGSSVAEPATRCETPKRAASFSPTALRTTLYRDLSSALVGLRAKLQPVLRLRDATPATCGKARRLSRPERMSSKRTKLPRKSHPQQRAPRKFFAIADSAANSAHCPRTGPAPGIVARSVQPAQEAGGK